MTRPFVSGLPGGGFETARAQAAPEGLAMLDRIRHRARLEAEALMPLAQSRFTGTERLPADPEAITALAEYEALVRMIDGVKADAVLLLRITALLAKRGSR